ncbi:MAG: tail fiber protein, partial [Victivallales bacterium]|nr:tail fiber protein [Victivallales bacterium]
MSHRMSNIVSWLFLLPSLLAGSPAFADATSFDPTTVTVEAKSSGGVPVGTIIAWPVATNPEDMDNWLECNGQSVDKTAFPELFAVVGAKVPDLRGIFLRGNGGNSNSLGKIQADAIRSPNGTGGTAWWMSMRDHHHGGSFCGGAGIDCQYWSHWRDGGDRQDGLY